MNLRSWRYNRRRLTRLIRLGRKRTPKWVYYELWWDGYQLERSFGKYNAVIGAKIVIRKALSRDIIRSDITLFESCVFYRETFLQHTLEFIMLYSLFTTAISFVIVSWRTFSKFRRTQITEAGVPTSVGKLNKYMGVRDTTVGNFFVRGNTFISTEINTIFSILMRLFCYTISYNFIKYEQKWLKYTI